jgi:hypothetical protein
MLGMQARRRWNISLFALFGADEMRPTVSSPKPITRRDRRRLVARLDATGGLAWNFPPETGFLSGGAMNCAPRTMMDSKGNVL